MVILTVIPLLYTVSASFKTNMEIATGGINLIPKTFTFDNYKTVWGMSGTGIASKVTYTDYTINSIKVSLMTVVLVVLFTSMSAYCFQRRQFPRSEVPVLAVHGHHVHRAPGTGSRCSRCCGSPRSSASTTCPVWRWSQFGTAGASNLFLTMGYLKTISKELDDAAKIDGCSFFSTWWRVILPLSKPILATVALMTFRASWNNYLLPNLMLARDQAATTLVVAVVKLQSSGGAGASQYNLMMAGHDACNAADAHPVPVHEQDVRRGHYAGAVKG